MSRKKRRHQHRNSNKNQATRNHNSVINSASANSTLPTSFNAANLFCAALGFSSISIVQAIEPCIKAGKNIIWWQHENTTYGVYAPGGCYAPNDNNPLDCVCGRSDFFTTIASALRECGQILPKHMYDIKGAYDFYTNNGLELLKENWNVSLNTYEDCLINTLNQAVEQYNADENRPLHIAAYTAAGLVASCATGVLVAKGISFWKQRKQDNDVEACPLAMEQNTSYESISTI